MKGWQSREAQGRIKTCQVFLSRWKGARQARETGWWLCWYGSFALQKLLGGDVSAQEFQPFPVIMKQAFVWCSLIGSWPSVFLLILGNILYHSQVLQSTWTEGVNKMYEYTGLCKGGDRVSNDKTSFVTLLLYTDQVYLKSSNYNVIEVYTFSFNSKGSHFPFSKAGQ